MSKSSSSTGTSSSVVQGYKKKELDTLFSNMNNLSLDNSSPIEAPPLQTRQVYTSGKDAFPINDPNGQAPDLASIDATRLQTLVDIYNRRVASINEKKARPGLLMTRGEL